MPDIEITTSNSPDLDLELEIGEELGEDIGLNPSSGDILITNGFNFHSVHNEECREQLIMNVIFRQSNGFYNENVGGDLQDGYEKPENLDLYYIKKNIDKKVLPNFYSIKEMKVVKYFFEDDGERKSQIQINVVTDSNESLSYNL